MAFHWRADDSLKLNAGWASWVNCALGQVETIFHNNGDKQGTSILTTTIE